VGEARPLCVPPQARAAGPPRRLRISSSGASILLWSLIPLASEALDLFLWGSPEGAGGTRPGGADIHQPGVSTPGGVVAGNPGWDEIRADPGRGPTRPPPPGVETPGW